MQHGHEDDAGRPSRQGARLSNAGTKQVILASPRDKARPVASVLSSWGGRLIVEQTLTAAFLLPALEWAGVTVDPLVDLERHGATGAVPRGPSSVRLVAAALTLHGVATTPARQGGWVMAL